MNKTADDIRILNTFQFLGLRCSTYVVLVILVILFVLLNLPGHRVFAPRMSGDKYGLRFTSEYLVGEPMEHGWPRTFLWRAGVSLNQPPRSRLSHWRVFEGVKRFDALPLAVDVLIALAALVLGTIAFEKWQRRRRKWQWYLSDMLFLMLLVACCMSYVAFVNSGHKRQVKILQAANSVPAMDQQGDQDWTTDADWDSSLPSWLQSLFGYDKFKMFDRVDSVIIYHSQQLKHVIKLRTLRGISIECHISNEELQLLERYPQLEALEMTYAFIAEPDTEDEDGNYSGPFFQIPALPKLRALDMYGTDFRGEGLENLPSLVAASLDETEVDDRALSWLTGCKHLKELSLCRTDVTNNGLRHLAQLSQLESLSLDGATIDAEGISHLTNLRSLKLLSIGCWEVDDSAIPTLKRFKNLERLSIDGTQISQEGRKELERALPNCEIEGP